MASKPAPKPGVKPKIPVTAPEPDPDTKQDSKAGVKPRTPASASSKPEPKPSREASKEKDRQDNKQKERDKKGDTGHGRSRRPASRRSRGRARRVSRDRARNDGRSDRRSRDHQDRHESSRSQHSDGPGHRRSPVLGRGDSGGSRNQIVCRDFLRKMCNRGIDCRFYHPPEESGNRGVSWFTFCHDYRMGLCNRLNCRYFHISRHDEDLYRSRGEISPQLVEEAVHKSLMENLTLIGTRPCCKDFVRGVCNMSNCRYRHLNQREYEYEVFQALQEELEVLFGPSERRVLSPSRTGGAYDRFDSLHDPIRPLSPRMSVFDDMLPMDDLAVRGGPHPDEYEPQLKRARFYPDGPGYPMEDMREGGQGRVWDERGDFERDRLGHPDQAVDPDGIMQEIMSLRNENVNLRREAESKIAELKEELNRVMQENSKLHADIIEKTNAHQAALKNLTLTNATLAEDRRKAQEQVLHLEASNSELRNALDVSVKTATTEKGKLEGIQRELTQVKDSLAKANGKIRQLEDEKSKQTTEIGEMRTKLQFAQTAANKMDQFTNKMGFGNRETYSRDSSGGSKWATANHGESVNRSEASWGGMRSWGEAGRDRSESSQAESHGRGRGRGEREDFASRGEAGRSQFGHRDEAGRGNVGYKSEAGQRGFSHHGEGGRWESGHRDRREGSWNRRDNNTWDHRTSSTWDEDMRTLDMLSQSNSRSDKQASEGGESNQGAHYNTPGFSRHEETKSRDVDARAEMGRMQIWQSGEEGNTMPVQWQMVKDSGASGNIVPGQVESGRHFEGREFNTTGYTSGGRNQYTSNGRHLGSWS